MCGIAGIVSTVSGLELRHRLGEMMRSIAHRGPDGEGAWLDEPNGIALGHKRLAIIDPRNGAQPMGNEDGSIQVVFNGCIYNYADIMRLLRQSGHVFRTDCDTEVIVHAYEEWGEECVRHFNGMWSFALWDSRKKTLFCSRDRVGVKPFYYAWDGSTFAFGSEIKALLASGLVKAGVDDDGLRQYLVFQYCCGNNTLFKGVQKLPPGHSLVLRPGQKPQIARYWDIHFNIDTEHTEEYFLKRLGWLIEDAVRLRLRSDVPLGAHLSGGLDSSTVVCMARMLLGELPLRTFTGAFGEGAAYDETRHAKLVSESAKTQYHEIYLNAGNFADSIEKIIWHMDEPAAGPGVFPQYWVSKLAAEHVKVVLGGQGGDEIFIGYARYLVAYLEECLKGAIQGTAHRAQYVATLETIVPSLPDLENYVPMLVNFWKDGLFEEPAKRYFRLMNRFSDSQDILNPDLKIDMNRTFEEFRSTFEHPQAAAKINRILYYDTNTHLQALLHVEDRTSMAHGLESRVPLLDYRLIELMASVPPTIKFQGGRLKHIFRKVITGLVPQPIMERRDKMGFPVPLNLWLAGPLRGFVSEVLLSKRCRERGIFRCDALEKQLQSGKAFSRGLWGALCLELWFRQFIDA